MAELTDKERIIKEVYENREQGYGSIKDTFKQAVKKDPSIKLDDVKKYLDKQPHRQTQFTYKKFNSFVSPGPNFEFEMERRRYENFPRYAQFGISQPVDHDRSPGWWWTV